LKGLEERHGRVAATGLLTVVLLFLAWQIIANAMAIVYAKADPERALDWNPNCAAALIDLAERRLGMFELAAGKAPAQKGGQFVQPQAPKADFAQARDLAERALRVDPLAPRALTDLGRIAESEGDAPRAVALMELAGKRGLRDAVAQGWLVNQALSRGDLATALTHLDAILRTQPEALDQTLPLLAAFISYPRAAVLLVHLVGTDPPWRAWFLNAVTSRIVDRAALGRFYAELQVEPHPPSQQEFQLYLDRLVKDGMFKEAYTAWAERLPPDRRAHPGTLYNGAFQYPLSGSEFDWKVVQSLGADVEIVGRAEVETRTLRLEFSGARVDFHNVSHLLALPPGTYRLTGEVEAEALHSERGLWWRVFCAGQSGPSLGQTVLVADSMPWRAFTLSFAVPADACPAQVLQLELPARVALEQAIVGDVSYRNLAIASPQSGIQNSATGARP
jgi:tetratricopeptide (TPR) repeat protein